MISEVTSCAVRPTRRVVVHFDPTLGDFPPSMLPPMTPACDESIAWAGGCTDTNEFNYLTVKSMRSLGVTYIENQARV